MILGNYIKLHLLLFFLDIVLYGADIRFPLAELLCLIRSVSVSIMHSCPYSFYSGLTKCQRTRQVLEQPMGHNRCPEAIKLTLLPKVRV